MKNLIAIIILLGVFTNHVNARELKIHAINVGWGQSVLIEGTNGKTILFDSGLSSKRQVVIDYLHQQNIQQLDYFLLSHNHADHGGSAQYIVREFKPKQSYYSGASENTERVFMKNWFNSYQEANVSAPVGMPLGHVIDLGHGATATAIAVNGEIENKAAVVAQLQKTDPSYEFPNATHINDSSIVILIKYKGFDYIVSGDLGGHSHNGQKDFETPVMMSALLSGNNNVYTPNGGIDILHTGHHGSKTSSNSKYLDLAKPEIAIVSVGPNQGHGLPNKEAIEDVLIKKGIKVLQTDEGKLSDERTNTSGFAVGHIKISTDGETYTITSDETGLDTIKQNVIGESAKAGLPLTVNVDNAVIVPPSEDLAPVINAAISTDLVFNAMISDDKLLTSAEIFIDQKSVKSFIFTDEISYQINYPIDKTLLTSGEHSIFVKVIDSASHSVNSTNLTFEISPVSPPSVTTYNEVENNDSVDSANSVADDINRVIGFFPYTNDDNDWFEVNLIAGETLNLALTGPTDYSQDYDLYLYSEGGTLLKQSEQEGIAEQLSYKNTNSAKTKLVRILVYRYSGYSSKTAYELAVSRL
jgi:competence protein ComEC